MLPRIMTSQTKPDAPTRYALTTMRTPPRNGPFARQAFPPIGCRGIMYRVEVDTNERCVYLNMMRAYNATANDLPAPMLLVRSGDHFLCAGLIFVFLADEDGGNARVELIVRPEATEGEQLDGKSS